MSIAPTARHCADCSTTFTATTWNRVRCDKCRHERNKTQQRKASQLEEIDCERCGRRFKQYKGDQRMCSPRCRRDRENELHRLRDDDPNRRDERQAVRDEQMERLFRYYRSRDNITITEAQDGDRVLVVSDHQLPFVDEPFVEAEDRFIADWRPNWIIYAGDVIDCYEISDFDKRPHRLFSLPDEIEMAQSLLERHQRLSPGVRQFWIDGNHEERVQRVIWRRANEFAFMVRDLPEQMKLDRLTEGFVPYGKHMDFLGFIITHGSIVRKQSAYTARAMLETYRSSGCSGHTHRAGDHSMSDSRGVAHTWYELGCHCRLDLEYMKRPPDWQHAFLAGRVWNGALHPHLVREIENGFSVEGQFYEVRRG